MGDYRSVEIIVSVIGKDNIMTDEQKNILSCVFDVAVSELVTVEEVLAEMVKRGTAIEDVL